MTSPSKPSLRSSSNYNYSMPTVDFPVGRTPSTHLGIRVHATSRSTNDCHQITKKQRLNPNASRLPNAAIKDFVVKSYSSAPTNTTAVTHLAVNSDLNSRITSAVQPPPSGTINTNGDLHPSQKHNSAQTIHEKSSKEADKRTLRSQDGGSRSRSELSLYFPNYEELISNEPKPTEFLTRETCILITDENLKTSNSTDSNELLTIPPTPSAPTQISFTSSPTTFEILNFSSLAENTSQISKDPLTPALYFKAHRRAERQEKQLRNIEKERSQHEKVQLERILDGLQGHDWLRVMGISGVTDGEKRAFEPKRDYFIREVIALIMKFRRWKEEEKRRKVEKDLSAGGDDDEVEEETDESASGTDVDLLAARQLHQEASSYSPKPRAVRKEYSHVPPSTDEVPFTSFYSKPYQRDAAVGKHRRGRTRYAFGHLVPEVAETEFELPREMLTEDMIKKSRRRRRMMRRGRNET